MSAARQTVESWIEGADESMRPALIQLCELITADITATEAAVLAAVAGELHCEAETFAVLGAVHDLRVMATARAELITEACRHLRLAAGLQAIPDDMHLEGAVELARDRIAKGKGSLNALQTLTRQVGDLYVSLQRTGPPQDNAGDRN